MMLVRLEQYRGSPGLDTPQVDAIMRGGDHGMKLEGNKELDVVSFHISSMGPIHNSTIGSYPKVGMVGFESAREEPSAYPRAADDPEENGHLRRSTVHACNRKLIPNTLDARSPLGPDRRNVLQGRSRRTALHDKRRSDYPRHRNVRRPKRK